MIDVTALSYSDAVMYCEDYVSEAPIYYITEEDFHRIATCYGMDVSEFTPCLKRFEI